MDTLYTFWDNITHYKTKLYIFWGFGLEPEAFRLRTYGVGRVWVLGFRLDMMV